MPEQNTTVEEESVIRPQWPPDRKVYYSAFAGLFVSFLAGFVARAFSIEMTIEQQGMLITLVTGLTSYFVPMAEGEILKRLNDRIVLKAALDKTTNVSKPEALGIKMLQASDSLPSNTNSNTVTDATLDKAMGDPPSKAP